MFGLCEMVVFSPFFGGGMCVGFVLACGHVLYNRVYICVVLVRLCKGD